MNPNLLEGWEQLLQLGYLLGKTLIHHYVMTPEFVELDMGQMSQVCLIQRLEVVEEGLHDILVKVVEGQELRHLHEDRVASLICQEVRNLGFLLWAVILGALEDTHPFEILLFFLQYLHQRAIQDGMFRDAQSGFEFSRSLGVS